jgi:hypothetical protein
MALRNWPEATADNIPRRSRRLSASFALAVMTTALIWLSAPPPPAVAQSAGEFVPAEESPEDYPEGSGRDETFYLCTACHGFKIVAQQGQSRRQWDETLEFMQEKHGMAVLEGDDRKVVLDYLEAKFPPRQAPAGRGWQNPFLGR